MDGSAKDLTRMATAYEVYQSLIRALHALCVKENPHHHMSAQTALQIIVVAQALQAIGFSGGKLSNPETKAALGLHAMILASAHMYKIDLDKLKCIPQSVYNHDNPEQMAQIMRVIAVIKALGGVRFSWFAVWAITDPNGSKVFSPENIADAFLVELFDKAKWDKVVPSNETNVVEAARLAAEDYAKIELQADPTLPGELKEMGVLLKQKLGDMDNDELYAYVQDRFDKNPEEARALKQMGMSPLHVVYLVYVFLGLVFHADVYTQEKHHTEFMQWMHKNHLEDWISPLELVEGAGGLVAGTTALGLTAARLPGDVVVDLAAAGA